MSKCRFGKIPAYHTGFNVYRYLVVAVYNSMEMRRRMVARENGDDYA